MKKKVKKKTEEVDDGLKQERNPDGYGFVHAQKPTKDGHYMGRYCGFNYKDGRYQVAQTHYRKMEEAQALENGIQAMIAAYNNYLKAQFTEIQKMRSDFWSGVRKDYELPDTNLFYHGDGWISVSTDKSKDTTTCFWCETFTGTRDEMTQHGFECKKHPLGIRIRQLEAELAKAKTDVTK